MQNIKPEYIVHDKQNIRDMIRISETFNDYFYIDWSFTW